MCKTTKVNVLFYSLIHRKNVFSSNPAACIKKNGLLFVVFGLKKRKMFKKKKLFIDFFVFLCLLNRRLFILLSECHLWWIISEKSTFIKIGRYSNVKVLFIIFLADSMGGSGANLVPRKALTTKNLHKYSLVT